VDLFHGAFCHREFVSQMGGCRRSVVGRLEPTPHPYASMAVPWLGLVTLQPMPNALTFAAGHPALGKTGPGSSGDLKDDRLKSRANKGVSTGVTFFRGESSSGITKAHARGTSTRSLLTVR
jgi:hypothetical protein